MSRIRHAPSKRRESEKARDSAAYRVVSWLYIRLEAVVYWGGGGIRGYTAYTSLRDFFDSVYSPQ